MSDDGLTVKNQGWIAKAELQNCTQWEVYLTSLYWGMTTMTTVGYGDIAAGTTAEKLYCIAAMVVGGFTFGIIIGNLTTIVESSSPLEEQKKVRLAQVSGWLHARNVPGYLRTEVYEFYRKLYCTERNPAAYALSSIDEQQLLEELPHQLSRPMLHHILGHITELRCWRQLRLHTLPCETRLHHVACLSWSTCCFSLTPWA